MLVFDAVVREGTMTAAASALGYTQSAVSQAVAALEKEAGTPLLERYAREYQSLKTIQLTGFHVAAELETKKAQTGVDAVGRVTLDITNSEGRVFTFSDKSRSVTISIARSVLQIVQYFANAERAFVTLYNARRDASQRGREDLVARCTGGRLSKKDGSSSSSTARSRPRASAITLADTLSPDWLACTSTWLA